MNIESHKRVLGILLVVLSAFQMILMLILSTFVTSILTLVMKDVKPEDAQIVSLVVDLIRYIPALVVLFVSVPSLIAGIGLLYKKDWAMILSLIIGCLNIFSFPVGTALGVYAIWVYFEDNKIRKVQPPAQT